MRLIGGQVLVKKSMSFLTLYRDFLYSSKIGSNSTQPVTDLLMLNMMHYHDNQMLRKQSVVKTQSVEEK